MGALESFRHKINFAGVLLYQKKSLEVLESLIHQLHSRSIIHVEFYPSKILWAYVEGDVKVRIVDWDGTTFVH